MADMDTQKTIGHNVRRRREQLRLGLDQLGELVGVSGATIWRYEQAAAGLPVSRLDALASALYCTAAQLADPCWVLEPPHPSFAQVPE